MRPIGNNVRCKGERNIRASEREGFEGYDTGGDRFLKVSGNIGFVGQSSVRLSSERFEMASVEEIGRFGESHSRHRSSVVSNFSVVFFSWIIFFFVGFFWFVYSCSSRSLFVQ